MKHMQRVFALLLVLLTACAAAAAEDATPAATETAFVFYNGISWDASVDDMLKTEGVYGSGKYKTSITGDVRIYTVDYSPTFEEHAWLSYTYFGEDLAIIGAYFVGETAADYAARLNNLTEKYGEPTEYDTDVLDAMFRRILKNISDRGPTFDGWLLSDGTRVYLLLDGHMYEYYMNEAVVLRMNEAE